MINEIKDQLTTMVWVAVHKNGKMTSGKTKPGETTSINVSATGWVSFQFAKTKREIETKFAADPSVLPTGKLEVSGVYNRNGVPKWEEKVWEHQSLLDSLRGK